MATTKSQLRKNFLKKYKAWRKKGDLEKLLKKSGCAHLWKAAELNNQEPMEVSLRQNLFMILPVPVKEEDGAGYFTVGNRVTLYRERPDNERALPISMEFSYVFPEKPWLIKTGCHGQYTLAQALYMNKTIGGDIICGGGIKHFWPSRKKELSAYKKLTATIAQNEFNAFIHFHTQEGWNWCFYKNPDGSYYGFAGIYLG